VHCLATSLSRDAKPSGRRLALPYVGSNLPNVLYTYCIPIDDGAAPNPFWGICTLAVCKPRIRRVAKAGDWVVGTGSKNAPSLVGVPSRDLSGQVVYAMRVSQRLAMAEYDELTRDRLRGKIPDWDNTDCRRRLGDSLYDFSDGFPRLRQPSVHGPENVRTDLGGVHVLLSDHFYYFGNQPVGLPKSLQPIVKQGQGHRSRLNQPFELEFVDWIETQGAPPNVLHGKPQCDLCEHPEEAATCAAVRRRGAEEDESLSDDLT
jgi:Nucleotide modification associated domain 2